MVVDQLLSSLSCDRLQFYFFSFWNIIIINVIIYCLLLVLPLRGP